MPDPHAGAPLFRQGAAGAARAVVLLHGRGGSAADMMRLGATVAPADTAFFAPEAAGRSWWPTSFLAPMAQLTPWLGSALAAVDRAVAAARAEGFAASSILLLGFSQGACLALEYAARSSEPWAGVCGLSGGLVGTHDAAGPPAADLFGHVPKRHEQDGRLDGVPIHIGCHEHDPHIPLRRVRESEAVFTRLGAACRVVVHPGAGHGVTPADIAAVRALIAPASKPT